jgi:hypothetical protein
MPDDFFNPLIIQYLYRKYFMRRKDRRREEGECFRDIIRMQGMNCKVFSQFLRIKDM